MSPLASIIAAKRKTVTAMTNCAVWGRFDDHPALINTETVLQNSYAPLGGIGANPVFSGNYPLSLETSDPPPTNPIVHFNGTSIAVPTTRKWLGYNHRWAGVSGNWSYVGYNTPGGSSIKFRAYLKTALTENGTSYPYIRGLGGTEANIGFPNIRADKTAGVYSLCTWTGASENNVWYRLEVYHKASSASILRLYDTSGNLVFTNSYNAGFQAISTLALFYAQYYNFGTFGKAGISDLVVVHEPVDNSPIGPQ
jgi:hypothetical protein